MTEAAFWGLVTGSSLVIGAIVTFIARPRDHIVGLVMAFGAGALISAVAYEMLGEAVAEGDTEGVVIGLLAGSLVFFLADTYIDSLAEPPSASTSRVMRRRASLWPLCLEPSSMKCPKLLC